jgi:hypothetical protein
MARQSVEQHVSAPIILPLSKSRSADQHPMNHLCTMMYALRKQSRFMKARHIGRCDSSSGWLVPVVVVLFSCPILGSMLSQGLTVPDKPQSGRSQPQCLRGASVSDTLTRRIVKLSPRLACVPCPLEGCFTIASTCSPSSSLHTNHHFASLKFISTKLFARHSAGPRIKDQLPPKRTDHV